MVSRIYVEKKKGYDVEAAGLLADLKQSLGLGGLCGLRILNRYDVEGLSPQPFQTVL